MRNNTQLPKRGKVLKVKSVMPLKSCVQLLHGNAGEQGTSKCSAVKILRNRLVFCDSGEMLFRKADLQG